MPAYSFQAVLSGDTRTVAGVLARGGLALLEPFYLAAVSVRNLGYDLGWLPTHSAQVPIVSIGNVTTGGTGKTPMVAWVTQQLQHLGARPALLSRGYRSLDESGNDEFRVLNLLCPGVPHRQQRDRVAGARQLVREQDCTAIVLDDAFQHRRLQRDLDVVLIDALNPFGYGHLLPRGLLRESLRGLSRADIVLITRGETVSAAELGHLQEQLRRWTSAPVLRTKFVPTGLRAATGELVSLIDAEEVFRANKLAAFCGIGNPAGFNATLSQVLGRSIEVIPFPDHHHYTSADLLQLRQTTVDIWLTTLKDFVKLPEKPLGETPVFALEIGTEFMDSAKPLLDRLRNLVE